MSDKAEKPTGTNVRRRVDGFVVTMACIGAIPGFLFLYFTGWGGIQISLVSILIGIAIFGGGTYFLRLWIFLVIAIGLLAIYFGSYHPPSPHERVMASEENHNRVRDFIATSFQKCAHGSPYIILKNSWTESRPYSCRMSADEFSQPMSSHFNWEGFRNPYLSIDVRPYAVSSDRSKTPPLGHTHIYSVNNALRIITNIGTPDKDNDYLTATVTKE